MRSLSCDSVSKSTDMDIIFRYQGLQDGWLTVFKQSRAPEPRQKHMIGLPLVEAFTTILSGFLAFLCGSKKGYSEPLVDEVINPKHAAVSDMLYFNSLRAAQRLRKDRRQQDARWIVDFVCPRIPTRCHRHSPPAQARGKIVLNRQTTKYERTVGVVLDRATLADSRWKTIRGIGGT